MSDDKRELPEGWRWVRLNEVTTVVNGTTPASGMSNYWNGAIIWITPSDLGKLSSPYIQNSERNITPEGLKSGNLTIVPPGSVILSSRAPIGYLGIAAVELCTNQGCKSFVPKECIDSEFLYFSLRNSNEDIQKLGSGATFTEVSKTQLENFLISLPPLEEQQRIAALLKEQMSAIDAARKAAEERLEAGRALPSAYFREVFPRDGDSLPDGWQWLKLGDACEINPRRPIISRDQNQPTSFIPMEAVDAYSGEVIELRIRPFSEIKNGYTYFTENDVLFSKITPCMQNGKHVIARGLIDGIGFGTTEFHVLRPKPEVIPEWIWYFVRQPDLLKKATEHFTGAVGQQRLPPDYLKSLDIPVAHHEEQLRITKIINEQMQTINTVQKAAETELDEINKLPASLLHKAFNGEL